MTEKQWYDQYWRGRECAAFLNWWDSWYLHREEEPSMPDNYYTKKAFALVGWYQGQEWLRGEIL